MGDKLFGQRRHADLLQVVVVVGRMAGLLRVVLMHGGQILLCIAAAAAGAIAAVRFVVGERWLRWLVLLFLVRVRVEARVEREGVLLWIREWGFFAVLLLWHAWSRVGGREAHLLHALAQRVDPGRGQRPEAGGIDAWSGEARPGLRAGPVHGRTVALGFLRKGLRRGPLERRGRGLLEGRQLLARQAGGGRPPEAGGCLQDGGRQLLGEAGRLEVGRAGRREGGGRRLARAPSCLLLLLDLFVGD